MKPIFISKKKLYYSLLTIVCLGIIVAGTFYNPKDTTKNKVSSKAAVTAIAEKPKPIIKMDKKKAKKLNTKNQKSKKQVKATTTNKDNKSSNNLANNKLKSSSEKLTAQNIESKIKEVEKSFVAGISEDIFDNISMDRDRTRDRQIELLREIINNPQSDKETRKKAQVELLFITTSLEKELETENILKANGYKDSVVFIQESGITVLMKKVPQNKAEVAKIKDIVSISTGVKAEDVSLLGQSGK